MRNAVDLLVEDMDNVPVAMRASRSAVDLLVEDPEIAETLTYENMIARIDATPELEPYRATITYDWPEAEEHYRWVCTAPIAEIVDWAETVEHE